MRKGRFAQAMLLVAFAVSGLLAPPALAQAVAKPQAAVQSNAAAMQALADFLRNTRSGSAQFVQTVTTPPGKSSALASGRAQVKTSSGQFDFQRPARFRFIYTKPYPQTIVADGKELWFYDPDLAQVSVQQQTRALASTPAALFASAETLAALRAQFVLAPVARADVPKELAHLLWVQATPKAQDGTLQYLRAGFARNAGAVELRALHMQDGFGQRSVLTFSQVQNNIAHAADVFRFTVPQGVDVLRP